ncbi:hypothetical protein OsJ_33310 [Oryza sativa Japonica Group]|uniref:Uncharacterized protein n=2 Tax=Oryza sativa subsp. japonica TaxID=39947 RepID=A3C9K3_ORYSJ|nr:hypothetical protein OsJ_33310 [Oryza sativa Japonica Group]
MGGFSINSRRLPLKHRFKQAQDLKTKEAPRKLPVSSIIARNKHGGSTRGIMFSGHSRDYPTNSIFYSESQEQKHVKEETHRLRQLLVEIHTALEAAKGCAITNSWLLRWLRELEDAACRGDQTLRNWRDMSSKVSSIIDSSNSFKRIKIAASQLIPSKESTMKVSATVKKLEAVASGIPKFTQLLSLQNDQAVLHHRPVIIFVSIHDRVVGRVDERKQAIEFLLHIDKNGSSSPDGCVLPIWGVKGVERLRMERFLLVLDGASSYPRGMNDILDTLFMKSRAGSKAIITTMYQHLATKINKHENLPVGFLAMEDLGCMFMENALGGAHPEEYQKLLVIGKKIAVTLRVCSPLAAKVVSGLLRENLNEKYWYIVLNRCQQFVASSSRFVTPFILGCKLLPKHLQRCFGVLGTYPRWTFTREELISYWMNNCVVVSENCMKNSIENVATDYFDDLVRKAFIQPSHIPGLYKVDDMLRDIALYIGPMPVPKTRIHLANLIGEGFSIHEDFWLMRLAE